MSKVTAPQRLSYEITQRAVTINSTRSKFSRAQKIARLIYAVIRQPRNYLSEIKTHAKISGSTVHVSGF